MKEDGGELLDEGDLDAEENDMDSGRGPQRGLRRIGEDDARSRERRGCKKGGDSSWSNWSGRGGNRTAETRREFPPSWRGRSTTRKEKEPGPSTRGGIPS